MNSPEKLIHFFGWCTAINIGILFISTIFIAALREPISHLHAMMFGLSEVDVLRAYFQYLGQFKIAVIVFNLVPYIALKIVASYR